MADLEGFSVKEFGKTAELYCRKDGVIQSLASFSTGSGYTYTVKFWSPAPVKVWSLTDSDGVGPGASTAETAGIVKFAPSSTKYFDRAGEWQGQIIISASGVYIKSYKFTINIGE